MLRRRMKPFSSGIEGLESGIKTATIVYLDHLESINSREKIVTSRRKCWFTIYLESSYLTV